MKTLTFFLFAILLSAVPCFADGTARQNNNTAQPQNAINIVCGSDFCALANTWSEKYVSDHPATVFNMLKQGSGTKLQQSDKTIQITTASPAPDASQQTGTRLTVGRQVIVPLLSSGNAALQSIYKQGITPKQLAEIITNPSGSNWSLFGGAKPQPIHIYITDDPLVHETVMRFAGTETFPAQGITVVSAEQLASAVSADAQAIGFCTLDGLLAQKNAIPDGIHLLPIDKNANGLIDNFENIYGDLADFQRGVWIGKYPKALVSNIYAVCSLQPNTETQSFLKWVTTDGQQYLGNYGFSELTGSESLAQADKLAPTSVSVAIPAEASNTGLIILLIAGALLLAWISASLIVGYKRVRKEAPGEEEIPAGFAAASLNVPNGMYFDKSHTWSFMEKNGCITVGVDDFLQQVTGPVSRLELLAKGEKVRKGDLLLQLVQNGKHLLVRAPFTGIISKLNDELKHNPSLINSSPYDNGWIYQIQPTNWVKDIQSMDLAGKYRAWLNTEFNRMKDFVMSALKPDNPEFAHVLLQDGGEIKQGFLADFGPEVWEEFQSQFLDANRQ